MWTTGRVVHATCWDMSRLPAQQWPKRLQRRVNAEDDHFQQFLWCCLTEIQVATQHNGRLFSKPSTLFVGDNVTSIRWTSSAFLKVDLLRWYFSDVVDNFINACQISSGLCKKILESIQYGMSYSKKNKKVTVFDHSAIVTVTTIRTTITTTICTLHVSSHIRS